MTPKLAQGVCLLVAWAAAAAARGAEPGLVAHYTFDQGAGAVLKDNGPGAHDGKIRNAEWVKSVRGHGLAMQRTGSCVDCGVESTCPYSALKIYVRERLEKGHTGWPVNVLTPEPTAESVDAALRTGPYGRCVYACDNDVVDHQVVNFQFQGDRTAVFTMTAFNKGSGRKTRIFGTRGEIYGDDRTLEHVDFLTDAVETIDTSAEDSSILGGHGGGDFGLMYAFVNAVAKNDPSLILSGPQETLESHLMVFAAERARLEGRVVEVG